MARNTALGAEREIKTLSSLGSHEADLMVLCARGLVDGRVQAAATEILRKFRDSNELVDACLYNKIFPYAGYALSLLPRHGESSLQQDLVASFSLKLNSYLRSRKPRVMRCLALVRSVLQQAGVDFMIVKGFPLAETYHQEPLLRVSADIDILVRPEQGAAACAALSEAGLQPHGPEVVRHARIRYASEADFHHPVSKVLVELCWAHVANAAIGPVQQDDTQLWARSLPVEGCERRMSPEDTIVLLIRHVGHSHDFDHAVLPCCIDLTAIMLTQGNKLDWEYICSVAKVCECVRTFRFFAHFYDRHYRDDSMPVLAEKIGPLLGSATDLECRLFTRFIIVPFLRHRFGPGLWGQIHYGNLRFCARFWTLDRLGRMAKLLMLLPWPSRDVLILLTDHMDTPSIVIRRFSYYINPLLLGFPGLLLGVTMRMLAVMRLAFQGMGRVRPE